MDIGSDLESLDSGGWTPLHCACAAARASCVNALIGRGADPTAVTPEGQRPSSLIGTVRLTKHCEISCRVYRLVNERWEKARHSVGNG